MPNGGNQSFTHHSVGISGNCEYCGRHLRKIGIERTNGKPINNGTGKDWESRKYHKGCWKKIQRDELYQWARTTREKEDILISFD
tara:strand:+ start:805 stop:1059 length:255 start_codon:yes stop_codon:yes gene_type:complete